MKTSLHLPELYERPCTYVSSEGKTLMIHFSINVNGETTLKCGL